MYLLSEVYSGSFDLERALYIASLINWHMRPYISWSQSEKSKQRDRILIGEQMFEDIIKLHEADVSAH